MTESERPRVSNAQPPKPLAGIRVTEISGGFAAGICGRMLASQGALVTRCNTDGIDRLELPTRVWLDTGKRIVADHTRLDLADADVILVDLAPSAERGPLHPGLLAQQNPSAIVTSVTPFGETGPWKDYRADALSLDALSGMLIARGEFGRPPVSEPRYVMELAGGLNAYNGTVAALIRRQRGGPGETVDVSLFESALCFAEQHWSSYNYTGLVARRSPTEHPAGMSMVECKDGYMMMMLWDDKHWQTFGALLGDDEFASYTTLRVRSEPELTPLVQEKSRSWFRERTKMAAFLEAQELQIPFGYCATAEDLLKDPQLAEREGLQLLQVGGHMLKMPSGPLTLSAGQQRIAPPNVAASPLPLEGFRVMELSAYWAGPLAGRLLADLGAEVIKIEGPSRPDPVRAQAVKVGVAAERGAWERGWWNDLNVGKKSLAIDLASQLGGELLREVLRRSDLLLDNFSRRVVTNLGLGEASVHELNPQIILLSMSAFGRTGPYRDFIAFGVNLEPTSGVTELVGYPDGPPELIGSIICDPIAGLAGAAAALTAIFERYDKHRAGHSIDMAQRDTLLSAIGWALAEYQLSGVNPTRDGNGVPGYAIHDLYACAGDDEYVAVSCREGEEASRLVMTLGLSARCSADQLEERLKLWCAERPKFEAFQQLQRAGVTAAPALTVQEVDQNPHLTARRFFRTIRAGAGFETRAMTYGFRFTRSPLDLSGSGARFGEHNVEVLRAAGVDEDRIAEARAAGIIADRPTLPFPGI